MVTVMTVMVPYLIRCTAEGSIQSQYKYIYIYINRKVASNFFSQHEKQKITIKKTPVKNLCGKLILINTLGHIFTDFS